MLGDLSFTASLRRSYFLFLIVRFGGFAFSNVIFVYTGTEGFMKLPANTRAPQTVL